MRLRAQRVPSRCEEPCATKVRVVKASQPVYAARCSAQESAFGEAGLFAARSDHHGQQMEEHAFYSE